MLFLLSICIFVCGNQDCENFDMYVESFTTQTSELYEKTRRNNERWSEEHCEQLLESLDEKLHEGMKKVCTSSR